MSIIDTSLSQDGRPSRETGNPALGTTWTRRPREGSIRRRKGDPVLCPPGPGRAARSFGRLQVSLSGPARLSRSGDGPIVTASFDRRLTRGGAHSMPETHPTDIRVS